MTDNAHTSSQEIETRVSVVTVGENGVARVVNVHSDPLTLADAEEKGPGWWCAYLSEMHRRISTQMETQKHNPGTCLVPPV